MFDAPPGAAPDGSEPEVAALRRARLVLTPTRIIHRPGKNRLTTPWVIELSRVTRVTVTHQRTPFSPKTFIKPLVTAAATLYLLVPLFFSLGPTLLIVVLASTSVSLVVGHFIGMYRLTVHASDGSTLWAAVPILYRGRAERFAKRLLEATKDGRGKSASALIDEGPMFRRYDG